ncbi:MAG: dockerin type I domain-containing protein [Bacteroidota bacterium]
MPNNLIALAWTDLYPTNLGNITYTTLGVAPNRRFIVNYSTRFFSNSQAPVQVQGILFEGTNEIEVHTTIVSAGGNRLITQGIENANGTIAFVVAGRNSSRWSGSNDAFRFTPESITEVARDTTDVTGAFLMPSIAAGNYEVVVTPNTPWGGVNATDAILTLNHFSNRVLLSGIRLTAADVNGSASVNSTDALNTLQRFVGSVQTFSAGNYVASTSSYTASGTGSGTLNVSMLCYGDVNASYQPNGGFVRTRWNDLSTQGVARITSGSYEVPLFVSRGVQPAGVSLELELPEGLRVLGVRASEGLSASQVVYHQAGKRVRMAWFDESGAELMAGEALCYVQVEGSTEGVWRSSTEVELANVLGEVQSGVELRMPKLSSSLGAMEASVYPNPGRGLRTLALELSEGMGVGVRVIDALGRTVYAHTAGTLAPGTHRMELNMEGWPAGSYQVQVLGATAEGKTHQRSITVLQTR